MNIDIDFPFKSEPWFEGFETKTLRDYVSVLKGQYSEKELADGFGLTIEEFRQENSKCFNDYRLNLYDKALAMKQEGLSTLEIARRLGVPEPTLRYQLKHGINKKAGSTKNIAEILMEVCDRKTIIDVGEGAELGSLFEHCARTKFKTAISICVDNGYGNYVLKCPQMGSEMGNTTKIEVLCVPGISFQEAKKRLADIKPIDDLEIPLNISNAGIPPITWIDSSRIYVRYADSPISGKDLDGLIQIRPGLRDLNLGKCRYAQVRIAVDGTHYMKGICVYSLDVPPGYDVIYNSNKKRGSPKDKVFKPFNKIKGTDLIDWDNPFSATIKIESKLRYVPRYYKDEFGHSHVSPINVIYEAGDWAAWRRNVSAQFLSKQQIPTVKKQLLLTIAARHVDLEILLSLTNPAVKQKLLYDFAEKCDRDAVELKAAPYPGQQYYCLVPFPDLAPDRIYAPNYPDGTIVILIRYPHAGPFEIPTLIVDNSLPRAKWVLENAPDAVGIHPSVAGILSGADFDGDFVVLIPVGNGVSIKTMPPLEDLKGYEPKELYATVKDPVTGVCINPKTGNKVKIMTDKQTQTEMGLITNLIADMEIMGAPIEHIVMAVRHSMGVIDAHKHELDYVQSYIDNGIAELKTYYQGGPKAGAATLITRAGSRQEVTYKKRARHDDPETGEKIFKEKKRTFVGRDGKVREIKKQSTKMYEKEDAFELLSDGQYAIEIVYGNFANEMKRLANFARKEAMRCPKLVANPSAKKAFAKQLESLNAKLDVAVSNQPRERMAQLYTFCRFLEKINENKFYISQLLDEIDKDESIPERKKKKLKRECYKDNSLDKEEKDKIIQQYLIAARMRFDAHANLICYTPEEWLAVNSGAVSQTLFERLYRYSNKDELKKLAMPNEEEVPSDYKVEYILRLNAEGFPTFEIADRVGLSVGKVTKIILENKPIEDS